MGRVVAKKNQSVSGVLSELKSIPFHPHLHRARLPWFYLGMRDALPTLFNAYPQTAGLVYPYPRPFRWVTFESGDGTPLSAQMALQPRPAPGLVLVHGLFGCKNQGYIMDSALAAYFKWGFSVIALDLRSFGKTRALTDAMSTGGWKEAEDVLAAARHLREADGVTSVGAMGFSLGAGSSSKAASIARPGELDGGVLCWNGYADGREALRHIDTMPPLDSEFFVPYLGFKTMLLWFLRWRYWSFRQYLRDSARTYDVDVDTMYREASPKLFLPHARTPTLLVHSVDDSIVPVRHAYENHKAARHNPHVGVWVLPTGGHCAYEAMDPQWYMEVIRRWFTHWAAK
ncbi:MAG: alpha/beta fold hydrolase [Euryarchaeota archaeon]|nr:alpha/beta fold hydrolase [Euryarchaeota archaeon]